MNLQSGIEYLDDDIEELEVLEEISDSAEDDLLEKPNLPGLFKDRRGGVPSDLLENESIRRWINRNKNSRIPVCLLNLDLKVIWTNLEFLKTLTYKMSPINHTLPQLFHHEQNGNFFALLKSHLEDDSRSFTWIGRVYPVEDNNRNTFIKTGVSPVLYTEDELPAAFACCWDIITVEFKDVLQKTFFSLLEASKLKDNDTGDHIERVNSYCMLMSRKLKGDPDYPQIDDAFIEDIGYLAAMHDVGKIGTPDDILNKGGDLDDWEREIMNEHTKNGAYILSSYPNPMARIIAQSHHEKWDGSGYPFGIFEDMIPLPARIVAIADVYDALRSKRSYKEGFSHEKAVSIIREGRGKHFDPHLTDVFLELNGEFAEIFENSVI